MENDAEPNLLPRWFTEILPPIFLFKNCHRWAESSEMESGRHLLPRLPAFLIKTPFLSNDTCLSNYWLLSSEQPNLSSVTLLFQHNSSNHFIEPQTWWEMRMVKAQLHSKSTVAVENVSSTWFFFFYLIFLIDIHVSKAKLGLILWKYCNMI